MLFVIRLFPVYIFLSHPRRIEGGDDRISTVSFRKNRFCALLKCVSFILCWIFMFQIAFFLVDFTRAMSFCKQVISSSFYPSWSHLPLLFIIFFCIFGRILSNHLKNYLKTYNLQEDGTKLVLGCDKDDVTFLGKLDTSEAVLVYEWSG